MIAIIRAKGKKRRLAVKERERKGADPGEAEASLTTGGGLRTWRAKESMELHESEKPERQRAPGRRLPVKREG